LENQNCLTYSSSKGLAKPAVWQTSCTKVAWKRVGSAHELILISLMLMLNVAGLALFAVSIYRGENLAGSGALFLAGLVVLPNVPEPGRYKEGIPQCPPKVTTRSQPSSRKSAVQSATSISFTRSMFTPSAFIVGANSV
jgi:hypothetical protein